MFQSYIMANQEIPLPEKNHQDFLVVEVKNENGIRHNSIGSGISQNR